MSSLRRAGALAVLAAIGGLLYVQEASSPVVVSAEARSPAPSVDSVDLVSSAPAPADDPVLVTGYSIDDPIDVSGAASEMATAGESSTLPTWYAVGVDGVIVGYTRNVSAPVGDPNADISQLIFDESGVGVIGRFVDGLPHLERE